MILQEWERKPKKLRVERRLGAIDGWCYVDRKKMQVYIHIPGNVQSAIIPMSRIIKWVDKAKSLRRAK